MRGRIFSVDFKFVVSSNDTPSRTVKPQLQAAQAVKRDCSGVSPVLAMCKGNRLRAAQVLEIGRTRLYRHLKEDGYDQTLIARSKAAGQ
jgi:DNA-binding NtrC family response regulator